MPSKTTNGPIHKVPCPHCGAGNDFTEVAEHLKNDGIDEEKAETGAKVLCDHCGQKMIVQAVRTITFIWVRVPNPGE